MHCVDLGECFVSNEQFVTVAKIEFDTAENKPCKVRATRSRAREAPPRARPAPARAPRGRARGRPASPPRGSPRAGPGLNIGGLLGSTTKNAFSKNAFFDNFANFWQARSRLYQNKFSQENMRLTAFFKLYKMCTLLHRSKLFFLFFSFTAPNSTVY